MPYDLETTQARRNAMTEAIRQAEEDAGPDDGSAYYAAYRAALVARAIEDTTHVNADVQVYPKGKGYGIRFTPRTSEWGDKNKRSKRR